MSDEWLSIQEAADVLGLHYRTAWAMARRGDLPAARDASAQGRPYRVRRSDVDAFIERARVKPGSWRTCGHL